jgi:hypothetical protein
MKRSYIEFITKLGMYYDKALNAEQVKMYADHLMVLSPDELKEATRLYQSNPENKFFPLPAVLIALIKPKENSELDVAREVSAKIIQAVSRFGSYRSKDAHEWIGEHGWKVVERQGGWANICQELNENNKGMLQAQMRDLALSIGRMSKNGSLDQPIGLPQQENAAAVKKLIGGVFK